MAAISAGAMAAGAAVGSAGGIINTGINGAINYGLQKDAQTFNSAEAVKQREFTAGENALNRSFNANQAQLARDWQERMSNTAIQRQMADMKAAGLNPAAIGQAGAGAPNFSTSGASAGSSGGGYAASSPVAHVSSMFDTALEKAMFENGDSIIHDVKKYFNRSFNSAKGVPTEEDFKKQEKLIKKMQRKGML